MHVAKVIVICSAMASAQAEKVYSQEEDLGEATGLREMVDERVKAPEGAFAKNVTLRGYLKGQYSVLRKEVSSEDVRGDAALEMKASLGNSVSLFGDLGAAYEREARHGSLFVNQLGIRAQLSEAWNVALGKERNRRSPGLLVSPSDVLHDNQPLPGMEEDRSGLWLARASWLAPGRSVDMIILPVDRVNEQGMPHEDAESHGAVLRFFQQFSNIDVQLNAGRVQEYSVFGASMQGFVFDAWKVYGEAGYRESQTTLVFTKEDVWSYLAGVGYEGRSDWTARLEYYRDEGGLSDQESELLWRRATSLSSHAASASMNTSLVDPFIRQNYVIASVSLIELADCWNVTQSFIHEVDGRDTLAFSRMVFLLDERNEVGLSALSLHKQSDFAQVIFPFDGTMGLDWKWSF